MDAFFSGSTWNFHAIILLSENSVKLNSISDSVFDKNVPFGVEIKCRIASEYSLNWKNLRWHNCNVILYRIISLENFLVL